MTRALNCTREMAEKHLDELAFELIENGIMMNAENFLDGVWSGSINTHRIFNHDETPQFINYGVNGSASGLIFTAKGDSCFYAMLFSPAKK